MDSQSIVFAGSAYWLQIVTTYTSMSDWLNGPATIETSGVAFFIETGFFFWLGAWLPVAAFYGLYPVFCKVTNHPMPRSDVPYWQIPMAIYAPLLGIPALVFALTATVANAWNVFAVPAGKVIIFAAGVTGVAVSGIIISLFGESRFGPIAVFLVIFALPILLYLSLQVAIA